MSDSISPTRKREKADLKVSPLAAEFLTWAWKRSHQPRHQSRGRLPQVVAFTTPEAIRWIMEQEVWEWNSWDLLVAELSFERRGKKLIHEDRPGQWSLTALCDFWHKFCR